jgi:hypothetical protein
LIKKFWNVGSQPFATTDSKIMQKLYTSEFPPVTVQVEKGFLKGFHGKFAYHNVKTVCTGIYTFLILIVEAKKFVYF